MWLPDSRQCCWHSCTARRQEVRFGRQGKTSRYVLQTYNNNNAWVRTRIGIGIGVYLRSCICSKMSKLGFPCIGLEIGLGHILCNISFLDIDVIASLSIGIWNWIWVYLWYIFQNSLFQRIFSFALPVPETKTKTTSECKHTPN